MKEHLNLPPLISKISEGEVTWQALEGIDYQKLGYFLSCHLVIEHYLDEYLRVEYPDLDWDSARQTFGQKVALLSRFKVSAKYDCIPAIKHMNSLRNKLSHNVDVAITSENLLPLTHYLEKVYGKEVEVPCEPTAIMSQFTTMTCVLFASYISGKSHSSSIMSNK